MEAVDLWLGEAERAFLGGESEVLLERRRCFCLLLLILLLLEG